MKLLLQLAEAFLLEVFLHTGGTFRLYNIAKTFHRGFIDNQQQYSWYAALQSWRTIPTFAFENFRSVSIAVPVVCAARISQYLGKCYNFPGRRQYCAFLVLFFNAADYHTAELFTFSMKIIFHKLNSFFKNIPGRRFVTVRENNPGSICKLETDAIFESDQWNVLN